MIILFIAQLFTLFCNTSIFNLKNISCIYLFMTPNSRSVFRAGVSLNTHSLRGARCSSVVRAFAHGAMGRGCGLIELFLVPASAPRLV